MTTKELKALPIGAVLQIPSGEFATWYGFHSSIVTGFIHPNVIMCSGSIRRIEGAIRGVPITADRLRDWLGAEDDGGTLFGIGGIDATYAMEEHDGGWFICIERNDFDSGPFMKKMLHVDFIHDVQKWVELFGGDYEIDPAKLKRATPLEDPDIIGNIHEK